MAYDFMEKFDKNNKRFKDEISKYIDENVRKEGHIVLGETPPVLGLAGANTKLPLVIPCEQINHIIDKHYRESNNYGLLEKEDTLKLYESIINPICLISGSEKDTCVVITDFKNKDGINIQVPIFFNMSEEFITVNDIASQYPNKQMEEYIIKEVFKHNLLAYHNKKLENSLRTIGLLLPVVNTNISSKYILPQIKDLVNSYDDSIIHNLDNVKYSKINNLENRYFKFNTDNKFFKPTFRANYLELNNACKDLGWGDALQYFTEGKKLSKVRDGEYLWKIEMFKYDKDREQLQDKLIELKTKEIEEKLKEIKSMLKVKEDIKDSVLKFLNGTSFTFEDKYGISPDQKLVGYCEETDREDLVYRICNEMQIDVLDEEGLLAKYYSDIPTVTIDNVYDTFYKDCHAVVDEMYKQSKENLINIREKIKEQLMDTINDFNGKTFDEKMLNFYSYYKDVYEKQHELSEDKGVGYNFAKDGNGACLIYWVEFRDFYGYEKEKSSLDFKTYEEFRNYKDNVVPIENEKLFNIYLKDVDDVCKTMYSESLEKTYNLFISKNPQWAKAAAEIENKDEKSDAEWAKDKVNELTKQNAENTQEKDSKSNDVKESDGNDGRD